MPSRQITIFVATSSDESISIMLHPHSTIWDIKLYLNRTKGIPIKDQHLVHKLQVLSDDEILEEIGLVNESALQLVPKSLLEVFTIFIKTHDRKLISATVRPLCTIFDLKLFIHSLTKILVENQNLFFNSRILPNDETIAEVGLVNGSTILLVPKNVQQLELPTYMNIFVKTHHEESISIKVRSNCTILDIKKYLRDLKGIQVSKQNLIFKYETLDDEKTVQNIGLVSGSSLQLVLNVVDGFKTHLRTPSSDAVRNYVTYVTFLKIFRQGRLILEREVNKFYCLRSTSQGVNGSLRMLVLSDLGINEQIIYDKEDLGCGSFVRLIYCNNSKELYEEEVLKCVVDQGEPPNVVVEKMPCGVCGLQLEIYNLYNCDCKGNFCLNHKFPESHRCKYHGGGAGKTNK